MSEISTKPYLIRAIYDWCADCGLTPYLSVRVDENTRVPIEHVKNGEIVLSMSQQATRNLTIGNDIIQFSARFNGVSREIAVPIYAVQGMFSRENGRGVFFEPESPPAAIAVTPTPPNLQSVGTPPTTSLLVPIANNAPVVPPPDKPKATPRGKLRVIK